MKLGMNHPMGPLTLADFIGLDVCVNILDVLKDGLGRRQVPRLPAAAPDGRGRPPRPEDRQGLLRLYERLSPCSMAAKLNSQSSPGQFDDRSLRPESLAASSASSASRDFAEGDERAVAPHAASGTATTQFPARSHAEGRGRARVPEGHDCRREYGGSDARQPRQLHHARGVQRRVRVDRRDGLRSQLAVVLATLVKWGTEEDAEAANASPSSRPASGSGPTACPRPASGSDAAALRLRGEVEDGDEWVLNGPKLWITTGSEAEVFIVFARTGEDRTSRASRRSRREATTDGVGDRQEGARSSASRPRRRPRSCSRTCAMPGSERPRPRSASRLQASRSTRSTAVASALHPRPWASRAHAVELVQAII